MIKRLSILAFTLLTMVFLGLIYGWSIFVIPLEAEFGWDRAETSLTFTISIMAMCIGILVSGQYNKNIDRLFTTALTSSILIIIGFGIVGNTTSLLAFYIFYGGFCGFGIGFFYVEAIAVATMIIPGRQGLLSGLLMMCFGFGAMILGTVCSSIMVFVGWRKVFLALGLLLGILIMGDGLLLRVVAKRTRASQNNAEGDLSVRNCTSREMIKRTDFKLIYIWTMLLSSAGLALIGHMVPCAIQIGAEQTTAALMAGIISVFNGVGRVVYGFLYDVVGVTKTIVTIGIFFLLSTIIVCLAVITSNVSLLIVGCGAIGISFGAAPTSSSVTVSKLYGRKYFSSNFGIISTQLMFAAVVGPLCAGKLYTLTGNYIMTFYGVALTGVVCLIITISLLRTIKKQ